MVDLGTNENIEIGNVNISAIEIPDFKPPAISVELHYGTGIISVEGSETFDATPASAVDVSLIQISNVSGAACKPLFFPDIFLPTVTAEVLQKDVNGTDAVTAITQIIVGGGGSFSDFSHLELCIQYQLLSSTVE